MPSSAQRAAGGVGTGNWVPVYRATVASNGSLPGPTCESCGGADSSLEAVRRVYLETGAEGTLRPSTTMPDVEWWCPACRATYPNEPAYPDGPAHPDEPAGG